MEDLKALIMQELVDGKLPCARAFALAERIGVDPMKIGQVATQESIKISHCQLGLFGYAKGIRPVENFRNQVTDELRQLVASRLVDGQLPCAVAWQISSELNIPKMRVSAAAEELKLRIRDCQLGCFS
jgi:hypothetical protein